MRNAMNIPRKLHLRAGDFVVVRSKEEIFATLDPNGAVDSLPFMPEMLQYCGRRFKVHKKADKTCDTITGKHESRRMLDTVHLEDVRCGGEAHGGCDALCLIFWKEAWLKRVEEDAEASEKSIDRGENTDTNGASPSETSLVSEATLRRSTRAESQPDDSREEVYCCQATELLKASQPMAWWDIRQYAREIFSRNVRVKDAVRVLFVAVLNFFHGKVRGWRRYPMMDAHLMTDNSGDISACLNLQPGESVQIKATNDILQTLNGRQRNRGLYFDKEMVKFCGRTVKVKKRVHKIIDDKSGRMIVMKNDCLILEGVSCCGEFSEKRLLCPRGIAPFWREIWLKRANAKMEQRDS